MASAMAGGANTNSISVAKPATKPPVGPKARRHRRRGRPHAGWRSVSSVKLKMKVVYIVATNVAVTRKPSVPAVAQP